MNGHTADIARFAIYARYSSPLQEMTSISGQLRLCRDRVADLGGVIAEEYTDPELSGTAMQLRPGLRQLLEDARAQRFDSVCVEGLDRLARSTADMAWLYRELRFLGIGLHSLEDGQVDSLHAHIKGAVSEMVVDNIGAKTRRGQIEALHDLRVMGHRIYGYRMANYISESGKPVRGQRMIDLEEADVVRRIYRLYLDGMSPQQIARILNREGVVGPNDKPWSAEVIRGRGNNGILRFDIYRGVLVYGRSRSRRHPVTGRRRSVPVPPEEWAVAEAPGMRIVDDETWHAVQDELERRKKRHLAVVTRSRKAAYPLTARLRCGVCGGHLVIAGLGYYRCKTRRLHPERCSNNRGIRREELECHAVQQLFAWMRSPERDWRGMFAGSERETAARRQELLQQAETADVGIDRLVAAIEAGIPSASLRDRLLDLERQRNEAAAELDRLPTPPPPPGFRVEAFVRDHLARFRGAVPNGPRTERREEALLAVRDLIAAIEIRPSAGPERVAVETVPDIPAILDLIARHAADGA